MTRKETDKERLERRNKDKSTKNVKIDLFALGKQVESRVFAETVEVDETLHSVSKTDNGFRPAIIDSSHDLKGWTFDQWREQLAKESLKEIPTKRDTHADPETMSAIYAAIGRRTQKYLKDGLLGIWENRQATYDKVVSISNKAVQCERLSRRQLFTWLPDVVECFYDDESVHELFVEMEEAGDNGLSDEEMDDWINTLTVKSAVKVMSVVQEDFYKTIDRFWSYICGYTVNLSDLERVIMAFKFGSARCDDTNFREFELKGLAKCLGAINPADYLWVESIEDFRSRAWALIMERRREQEVEVVESKKLVEAPKVIWEPPKPPKPRPHAEVVAEVQAAIAARTVPPVDITPDEVSKLTDSTKLEACSYSTDPEILVAVHNNKYTPWSACERCMENEVVFKRFCQQADERTPVAPVQRASGGPSVSDLELAVTSTDSRELERIATTTNDPIVRVAIIANGSAEKDLKLWLKAVNSGLQMTYTEFVGV